MVKCQCPLCKESFEAEAEWLGQEAQCPYCKQKVSIQPLVVTPRALSPSSAIEDARNAENDRNTTVKLKISTSADGISSLILGIVGMVAWLLPFIGYPVTLVGLTCGCREKYILGIGLNGLGLTLTCINSLIGALRGAGVI